MSDFHSINDIAALLPNDPSLKKTQENTLPDFLRAAEEAMSLLTPDEKSRLPEIEFGVLPTIDANAWAIPLSNGRFGICIDVLLPEVLLAVSWIMLEWLRGHTTDSKSDEQNSLTALSRPLWLSAKWFLTRDVVYAQETVRWQRTLPPMPTELSGFVSGFLFTQLKFIVLHELQHILCGHIHQTILAVLPDKHAKHPNQQIEIWQRSIENEFEADQKAIVSFSRDPQGVKVGEAAIAEILFLFLSTVETLMSDQPSCLTHPPPQQRLEKVRSAYKEAIGDIQGFGKNLRPLLDDMFAIHQDMFRDFPKKAFMNPESFDRGVEAFIRAVLDGEILTQVMLVGEITTGEANAIAKRANGFIGDDDQHVNVGTLRQLDGGFIEGNLPHISFVQCVSAITLACTGLFLFRKEGIGRANWNASIFERYLLKHIAEYGNNQIESLKVLSFDTGVLTDGELCTLTIKVPGEKKVRLVRIAITRTTVQLVILQSDDRS